MNNSNDWLCTTCNIRIYGHKSTCLKCGAVREISKQIYNTNKPRYEQSMNMNYKISNISNRYYDWTCQKCNILIFGSKRFCYKCNTRNPYLPIDL